MVTKFIDTRFSQDIEQGRQVLWSYMGSSFFEWDNGSTLIFWRWPNDTLGWARDGICPYYVDYLPTHKHKAKAPTKDQRAAVWKKFLKSLERNYLTFVPHLSDKSYVDYFLVPKGTDIRMVLNGTSCGLNKDVYTPNFWLP